MLNLTIVGVDRMIADVRDRRVAQAIATSSGERLGDIYGEVHHDVHDEVCARLTWLILCSSWNRKTLEVRIA